jgi:hypothetical protein
MFSLSGIHPTNTSYAVIAIQLITTLNRTRGTSIPPVSINQVASGDPLVFGEVRSEIDASVNREGCSLCATRRRRRAQANQPRHQRKQRFRMDRKAKGVNMVNLKGNSPHPDFG